MFAVVVILSFFVVIRGNDIIELNRTELLCSGRPHYNVSLTAYYPDYENDYLDAKGKKLRTLQDYLDGRGEYVTVAINLSADFPYGTSLCIPELNEHFGRRIPLQARDHGVNLKGKSFSRLDICVRSEVDSYDNAVNKIVTVYTKTP